MPRSFGHSLLRRVSLCTRFARVAPNCTLYALYKDCMRNRHFSSHTTSVHENDKLAGQVRDALQLLQLSSRCTDAELKTAYYSFAKKHHPDTYHIIHSTVSNRTIADDDTAMAETNKNDLITAGIAAYTLLCGLGPAKRQHLATLRRVSYGSIGICDNAEQNARSARAYAGEPNRPRRHGQQRAGEHSATWRGCDDVQCVFTGDGCPATSITSTAALNRYLTRASTCGACSSADSGHDAQHAQRTGGIVRRRQRGTDEWRCRSLQGDARWRLIMPQFMRLRGHGGSGDSLWTRLRAQVQRYMHLR